MKRKIWFLAVLVICAFLPACSSRRDVPDEDDQANQQIESGQAGHQAGSANVAEITPEPEAVRLVYVALGDSVSEGFGISPADRHTTLFFQKLQASGFANEYVNMAVSGFTTSDVLRLLNELNDYQLDDIYHASVITLNIGGNNVLAPFWEFIPDADELQRITAETVDFATDAWQLALEIMSFVYESREAITEVLEFANEVIYFAENFSILDIFRLNQMVSAASPIMDGAMEVFEEVYNLEAAVTNLFDQTSSLEVVELFSLLTGSFPPELEAEFQASLHQFSSEFEEILTWLASNAPNAIVIVNTVYNPFPTNFAGMPIGFVDESELLIQALNRIIYEKSLNLGLPFQIFTPVCHIGWI